MILGMKKKIASYEAPDLSGFDKRLAVIEENSGKTSDYTRDIKNDWKNDIRRNETVTEQVERSVKNAQRETESEMRDMRKAVREDLERARTEAAAVSFKNDTVMVSAESPDTNLCAVSPIAVTSN